VQAALHANQTRKLPWRWSDCTRMISYSRDDLLSSMLPTYKNLLKTGACSQDASVGCICWVV
jgi:serine carboxypeptidase-like clade 2